MENKIITKWKVFINARQESRRSLEFPVCLKINLTLNIFYIFFECILNNFFYKFPYRKMVWVGGGYNLHSVNDTHGLWLPKCLLNKSVDGLGYGKVRPTTKFCCSVFSHVPAEYEVGRSLSTRF